MNPLLKTSLLGAFMLGLPLAALSAPVTVKGPETLAPLVQKWLQGYLTNQPAAKIRFKGGGADSGLAALQNRQTDVALASRKIKPAEEAAFIAAFGKRPREY